MTKFVGLHSKTYAYLIDDFEEEKRNKGVKKCVVKNELNFSYYRDCLFSNDVILKSQQRFKSKLHNVYTEEVNKIAVSNNDDKRVWTFNKITSYPYGCKKKTCRRDLLEHLKYKMIIFDEYTNENKIEHNSKWPYISDHPYRILT